MSNERPSGIAARIQNFRQQEDGAMTVLGLFIFMVSAILGGLAVDVTHLISQRTKLQVTADLAAHAALYVRDSESEGAARDAALQVVANSMPASEYGDVLADADILFGVYDRDTEMFKVDNSSRSGVLVTLKRHAVNGNSIPSFLLQFVGIDTWDVTAQAVFTTFRPACLREGFVAEGVVDMQSNNGFSNGFCIHSNTHVSLNNNNTFEAGTVVSMPDLDDLDMPNNGFEKNEGLETALREGRMHIRVLDQVDEIYDGLLTYGSRHMPAYIDDSRIYRPSGKKFSPSDFAPGTINYLGCNNKITLQSGTYREIVIVATCKVSFGSGVILEDVTILTTSTDAKSITSSSGLQVGRNDNCAVGGGAQVITYGGMDFPANLNMYGGQLIALGDINFAANANGIQGASMIARGTIDGTSRMNMAFCGSGMEDNFEANYFRMSL
ncbi:Tad domain-containing protein [Thalassorhabdomicrobium marinisediminis]|uniref:Tad domain-containing protein n=1 Tax=Thalassorhabdomicrobium marinisediminis TaxID=2170577 RepID=UPI002490D1BB|nr:Tad domain-containing protein [Thalassorhabdomicrobium marinisediminis]